MRAFDSSYFNLKKTWVKNFPEIVNFYRYLCIRKVYSKYTKAGDVMSKVIQTIEKFAYDEEGRLIKKFTQVIELDGEEDEECRESGGVTKNEIEELLKGMEEEAEEIEEPFGYVIPAEVIRKLKPRK